MLSDWLMPYFDTAWLPAILFFGAFGDAFIGTSLIIWGEFVFIAGGYALAVSDDGLAANGWLIPLIWCGALTGDLSSYFIGRRYGEKMVDRFIRSGAKRRLNYQRAKKVMRKRGGAAIFTARITGPVAKFMPFIAGTMHLSFKTVFIASLWGVIIGTFQFFLVGYFLAKGLNYWDTLRSFVQSHPVWVATFVSLTLALFYFWRKRKKCG